MDREIILAFVAIIPQLLVLLILVVGALMFRREIGRTVGGRLTSVSLFGLRVELTPAAVDDAVSARASSGVAASGGPATGSRDRTRSGQIVERAKRLAPHMAGRTILWVDDRPAGNRIERRLMRQMGLFVEAVASNAEAMVVLDDPSESIALVISDIQREPGPSGLDLLAALAGRAGTPGVVFYVGSISPDRPTPAGAFGIADRPDDLLNLVMDAVDRLPERT